MNRPTSLAALVIVLMAALAPLALADGSGNASTSANVRDRAPEAGNATAPATAVLPRAGGTVSVPVSVRAADANGHRDLDVRVQVLLPDGAGEKLAPRALTGVPRAGSSTEADFPHEIVMDYWDAPGTYTVTFTIADKGGQRAPDVSVTFVYGDIVALHLAESALDFGQLDPGTMSAARTATVSNYGNVAIDVEATATDLASTDAVIPSTSLLVDGQSLAVEGNVVPLGLAPGASSSDTLSWALAVPNVPVGDYRGQLTLAAIASA